MQAKRYDFMPEVVKVKAGTLVTLKITAVDGTHGFALGAFGIDERLEEGEMKVIEFYASKPGEYGFSCSHFCGIGHLGMKGKVVVEQELPRMTGVTRIAPCSLTDQPAG